MRRADELLAQIVRQEDRGLGEAELELAFEPRLEPALDLARDPSR